MSETVSSPEKLSGESNLETETETGASLSESKSSTNDPIKSLDGETDKDTTHQSPSSPPTSPVKRDVIRKPFVFVQPDEGTPAAEALAANAAIKVSKVSKGIKKIRNSMKGTPNIKSLNIVRQIRKHTKRAKKKNHFSRNFKGKVIDGVHELYTLTAGIILGMRGAVGYFASLPDHSLSLEDFSHVDKQVFPAKGNSKGPRITPPHSLVHTFKFKSYAPKVFARIRELFNIEVSSYMESVCGNYNFLEFIANSKSGQFFFYSHDGKYMIKTQTKEENKFMRRILPHYFKFMSENPHTFLVKIVDMHRVKMYHINRKVHFVIMTSVFDTPEKIHSIYDLKGSLVGRKVKDKEREANPGAVLKDVNFLEDKMKIKLGPKKQMFMDQLRKDSEFLASLNIMDYSLLFGIHNRTLRTPLDFDYEPNPDVAEGVTPTRSNLPFRNPSIRFSTGRPAPLNPQTSVRTIGNSEDYELALGDKDLDALESAPIDSNKPEESSASVDDILLKVPNGSIMNDTNPNTDSSRSVPTLTKQLSSGKKLGRQSSRKNFHEDENSKKRKSNSTASTPRSNPSPKNAQQKQSPTAQKTTAAPDSLTEPSTLSLQLPTSISNSIIDPNSSVSIGSDSVSPVTQMNSARLTNDEDEEYDGYEDEEEEEEDEEDDDGDSCISGNMIQQSNTEEARQALERTASIAQADPIYKLFRIPSVPTLPKISLSTSPSIADINSTVPVGPSATKRHPWTGRIDNGINSRIVKPDNTTERGNEIYYMGIIDILQQYNTSKKLENFFKGFQYDRKQISAVSASEYAKRFVSFIDENTI